MTNLVFYHAVATQWARVDRTGTDPEPDPVDPPPTGGPNPDLGFEVSTAGWTAGSNTVIARVTTPVQAGVGAAQLSSLAAGDISMSSPAGTSGFPVVAGRNYLATMYVRTSATGRANDLTLTWYNSAGTALVTTVTGASTTSGVTYDPRTVLGTAPATAAFARITLTVRGTGGAGAVHYADTASLVASTKPNGSSGLTATVLSDTSIRLNWAAATVPTGAPAITAYKVYTVDGTLRATVGVVTTTTISGLTASTSYSYYVTAVNSAGESPLSPVASATTTGTPTGPPATVTHGRQITVTNTGHTAYFDTGLGRAVVDGDLVVHTGAVSLSDFVSAGGTITKHWFKGGLIFDEHDVTIRACRFDEGVSGYDSGVHYRFHLDYCTIDTPGAAGDDGIHYQDYTANRCRIGGNSDGAKINGNVTITESYLRCESQDAADHNDGVQNVGGNGAVNILRCNIDCRPTNGSGGPNAALFAADGATGLETWNDNLVAGGGYVIRCYESATYEVQGNDVVDGSWGFGPAARAGGPTPADLNWGTIRPNRIVSTSGVFVSTLTAP